MRIAIIHNLPEKTKNTKDTLSDDEALEIAHKIKGILKEKVEIFRFDYSILPKLKEYDVVINLAEKTYGSKYHEYDIVKSLEKNRIVFTGSSAANIELTSDKDAIKEVLKSNNVLTPGYIVADKIGKSVSLNFPLIVKPVKEHGSIGITNDSFVRNIEELRIKVEEVTKKFNQASLIEEYIEGREINAAILDEEVLPLSEIRFDLPKNEPKILTYDAKWDLQSSAYIHTVGVCPIVIDKVTEGKVKEIALKVFRIFSCSGYARVDFRIKNNIPYVIDVNPNPCINDDAGFFRSAKAAGYSYEETIKKIIFAAMKKNINSTELEITN